jgi:hypothetical protein
MLAKCRQNAGSGRNRTTVRYKVGWQQFRMEVFTVTKRECGSSYD